MSGLIGNFDIVANSRIQLDACRLLVLQAAKAMDTLGNKEARVYISAVKAFVPKSLEKSLIMQFKCSEVLVFLSGPRWQRCIPIIVRHD